MTIIGLLAGLAVAIGLLLLIAGARPHEPSPKRPRRTTPLPAFLTLTRTERTRALLAAGVGLLVALFTGFVLALIVLPWVVIALPRLFSTGPEKARLDTLEALKEWTRSLAGVLTGGGAGLTDALGATLRSAPAPIRPQVELLVARLNARRPAEQALRAFADDLDDAAGDLVAATLIMGSRETGAKLATTLTSLADSVETQTLKRRDVEAARAGPRQEMKLLVGIFTFLLIGFITLTDFGRFYVHGIGQFMLIIVLAMFLGCLYWLRSTTRSAPSPRFLATPHAPGTKETTS